jgi:hypothetical protein
MSIHTFNVYKHGLLIYSKLGYSAQSYNLTLLMPVEVWCDCISLCNFAFLIFCKCIFTLVRHKLEWSFNCHLRFCQKIKKANITCTYSGEKSQKFAPAEKNSYTVSTVFTESAINYQLCLLNQPLTKLCLLNQALTIYCVYWISR